MAHELYRSCIEACHRCADACDHCAAACLAEPDVQQMAQCIRLDIDCAEICRLAPAFMARGSSFAQELCIICADVCETCGDECRKFPMAHCQACADACARCADECRRMGQTGAGRTAQRATRPAA